MAGVRDHFPKFCEDVLSLPPLETNDTPPCRTSNLNLSWSQSEFVNLDRIEGLPGNSTLFSPPQSLLTSNLIQSFGHHSLPVQSTDFSPLLSFEQTNFLEDFHTDVIQEQLTHDDTSFLETSAPVCVAGEPRDSTKPRSHQRLSPDAVRVLRSWFHEHRDDPYPSECEKKQLTQQTGLSATQISNWFNNARRRKGRAGVLRRQANPVDSSLLSPLERWKNSPPETEPAATSDIMRALEEVPYSGDCITRQSTPHDAWSSNSSSASFIVGALSASSFEHSQSSGSELSYNKSQQQRIPRPPTPLPGRRSRRRRNAVRTFKKPKAEGRRAYQCTFCSDSFLTKYDWQRHEKTLHLPVDRWVCAPQGGIVEVDGINVCVFCGTSNPSPTHLEDHNFLVCREKSPDQRTFSRKDHLKQHLKLTHNVGYQPSMDAWRETRTQILSSCGFCGMSFSTWEERVEHVADHFKAGADMIQWKGDWGFEPEVQELVENALPPYLLGHERNTMDPWKTTDVLGPHDIEELCLDDSIPNALNRYTNLHQDLIVYIRNQLAAGRYPSDQELQDLARQIAYGNDDRWNQTYADDPVWLDIIKREAGLGAGLECDYASQPLFALPEL